MPRLDTCRQVFFSFPQVTDPARHRDYNAWHQLDHQPENRALDGVLHGDRWVRTPQCRAASPAANPPESPIDLADYVAMYWFADPVDQSVAEWLALGSSTEAEGRRPELAWTTRRLTGFFRPLEGSVAEGVPISPSALPYRAHRGVLLEVLRVDRPDEPITTWQPPQHEGIVGTWTFASTDVTIVGDEPERWREPGALLVALHFCDVDPVALAPALERPAPAGTEVLLCTPLASITPFAWDWFDQK